MRAAQRLKILTGKAYAAPGHKIDKTEQVRNALACTGYGIEVVIEDLLQNHMIRDDRNGNYSVSTVGANAMDKALSNAQRPNSLGSVLSHELRIALSNMKFS
jgi:hypothetical protein